MKTELGIKEGNLNLIEEEGILSGEMDILRHVYPLTGKMINATDGWFRGKIQTRFDILDYELKFHRFKDQITGEIKTSKWAFRMEGVMCA